MKKSDNTWKTFLGRFNEPWTVTPYWDRREDERTRTEIMQEAGITRYEFAKRTKRYLSDGSLIRRMGADGKVYFQPCPPEKSTPKHRSQRPSDSSPS